jgi:hypothetical protein
VSSTRAPSPCESTISAKVHSVRSVTVTDEKTTLSRITAKALGAGELGEQS